DHHLFPDAARTLDPLDAERDAFRSRRGLRHRRTRSRPVRRANPHGVRRPQRRRAAGGAARDQRRLHRRRRGDHRADLRDPGHRPPDNDLGGRRESRRRPSLFEARPPDRPSRRRRRMTTAILARPTLGQRLAGPLLAAVEFLRLLSRRPVGLAGFVGIVFFLLLAFVAPLFVPFQNDPSLLDIYLTPSLAHPLGTDFQGKDVLNQIVFGGRDILTVAIIAAFLSTLIAITFTSIAAAVGGNADT